MDSDTLEYIKPDTTATDTVAQMPNYIDSLFSMTWHGEESVSRRFLDFWDGLGVMGETIPYSLQNDDIIVITLLVCTIFSAIFWTLTRGFLSYQLYNILQAPREGSSRLRETEHQKKFLWYFELQWCVLVSIFCYAFTTHHLGIIFSLPSWTVFPIYAGIILLCIMTLNMIRSIPHSIYFERKQLRLYHTENTTFMTYYGMLILPFAISAVYLTDDVVLIAKIMISCLGIVKILEISKVYSIFFRKNGGFLQFFLYLCTLEAVPILLTVGILTFATLLMSRGVMP